MTVIANYRFKEATAAVLLGARNGLKEAAEKEKTHAEGNYDSGQDATGQPWQELAPATVERKGHGKKLYERGDTRNSFYVQDTGPLSVALGNSSDVIGYHEYGTEDIPAREVLGPMRRHLEAGLFEETVEEAIRTQLALGAFRQMF